MDMEKMQKQSSDEAPATLAGRIWQLLRELDLSQAAFARSLGVSANYIYLLTSGRKHTISEPLARLIEQIYGYPAVWLLSGQTSERAEDSVLALRADAIRRIGMLNIRELQAVEDFIIKLERDAAPAEREDPSN